MEYSLHAIGMSPIPINSATAEMLKSLMKDGADKTSEVRTKRSTFTVAVRNIVAIECHDQAQASQAVSV